MQRNIFLFFLFVPGFLLAQNEEKISDLYYEGNEYIMAEEYNEALPLFLELVQITETENIHYKIGECYLHLPNQKKNAIPHLEKAVLDVRSSYNPADPNETHAPLKALLCLGQAYRINNEIDKAINTFKALSDSVKNQGPEVIKEINREIEVCENARLFLESPVTFDAASLGTEINNHFSNYNAVITAKEDKIYYMNALKFYDAIMEAKKQGDSWIADNITMKLKSDGDFYITDISEDGSRILFYFYNILSMGDLYESHFQNGEWSPITKLKGSVNSKYHESHASLSNDGKTLYFTSNRPGGFGGLDIYTCRLNDSGEWVNPENLDSVINTPKNEDTPFITGDDKKLYFASEGHFNMGGYDVFKAVKADEKWSKPANPGYPVNSTDDNLYFYPHNDGNTLYLSRFSPQGEGLKDIYRYWNISEPRLRKFRLRASVSSSDNKRIDPQDIKIDIVKDGEKYDDYAPDDEKFQYRFRAGNYKIIASAKGHLNDTATLYLDNGQESLNFNLELVLRPLVKEENISVAAANIEIRNIYFDFDSHELSGKDKMFLDNLYQAISDFPVNVLLSGYTDNKGPAAYNVTLSGKRATMVKNYLVSIGLDQKKIIVKAFGEENAITKNQDKNGNDLPESRKYNRRVEITIEGLPDGVVVKRFMDIPTGFILEKW